MPLNTELLLQVKQRILAEPRQFDMTNWFRKYAPGHIPNCGTTACIAGWAICCAEKITPAVAYEKFRRRSDVLQLLGLNKAQAECLFYEENWPDEYQCNCNWCRYCRCEIAYPDDDEEECTETPQQKAQRAADYIDYFIEQHGEKAIV